LTTDVLAKLWFRASLLVRRNAGLFVIRGQKESPRWLNKRAQRCEAPTSISARKNKRERAPLPGRNI
jgi:hypothetical protein